MWTNAVEQDRPQITIWSMRITSWIPKATNIHSEYIILIASPLQQWLHQGASMLLYTLIACLLNLFCSCEAEFSFILAFDATSLSNEFMTFREIVMV